MKARETELRVGDLQLVLPAGLSACKTSLASGWLVFLDRFRRFMSPTRGIDVRDEVAIVVLHHAVDEEPGATHPSRRGLDLRCTR
jgi:hypothetical protein